MNTPPRVPATTGQSKILLIDDDRAFCALVTAYLKPFGYTVASAYTGRAGVDMALAEPWQAIILDVMLPEMDGFEVLRRIRATHDVPVLMLTARGDEADQIVGLEIGADDYLAKGSSTRQLVARLHAITRRAHNAGTGTGHGSDPAEEIVIAQLRINPAAYKATLGGEPLVLTPGEFAILVSLAKAKGRVKTRDHLLAEVRDREYEVFDRAIDVQVSSLRRKLGDDPKNPRFIRTVRSAGYMLMDPDVSTF